MREMKDSGIEWIGKIPDDWNAIRIKFLAKRIIVGLAMPVTQHYVDDGIPMFRNTNIEEDNLNDSDILYLNPSFAKSQSSKWIKTNDILTIHTGYIGKSCVVPAKYNNALTFTTLITTPDVRKVNVRFLMYSINASRGKSIIYLVESTAQNNLNTAVFVNLPISVPLLNEQNTIVSFLDAKCSEIDSLHADIEKQIETLEAYKKSVITEAVTKGLDPNVEMKVSGIEWIGEIPKDWEILKIGGLYSLRITKVSDVDYPPLSVTMKGILPQLETAAKTNDHDNRKLVKKGDFAINSRSDRRGSCGISEYDGSVSLINTVLKPNRKIINRYYNWLFHTPIFADEFYKWGHGIVDDLWTTGWQDMKNITVPFPSVNKQQQIADYLDAKCTEIESLISDKQKQLTLLEDYKKSLIYEYVTGKKEV